MRSKTLFVGVTISLGILLQMAVLLAFGAFGGGSPTVTAPSPMPLFIVYSLMGPAAFGLPVVFFWLWCLPLFKGSGQFPGRSLALLVLGVLASITWFWLGRWQDSWGPGMPLISAGLVVLAMGLGVACRRSPRFWLNAAAHWVLFAWLSSYAFPWLGEVP